MQNTTSTNWFYNEIEVNESNLPQEAIGFVYEITEISTGKKYIGKKSLFTNKYSVKTILIKSGPNKGTKKKKKTKIPIFSDWQDYYGSSDALKTAIETYGKSNYTRRILKFCYSKSELSYFETKAIFDSGALLSDKYYNSWVSCKIHKAHIFNKIKNETI